MSTQIQRRRGTTAQHASFTGAVGETTIDTDKEVVVVHDGVQVGGYPLMRENGSNSALSLGSAGTPSLKFTGDTNTGIYSPGADQVAISTNGTGRLFVDASGNVGINVASPSSFEPGARNLVVGSGSGDNGLSIYSGTANQGIIYFADGTTTAQKYTGFIAYDHNTNAMRFGTNDGNERLRIDSSGRVGIGTSSPSSILDVSSATSAGRTNVTFTNPATANTANRIRLRLGPSAGYVGSDVHPYIEAFCENAASQTAGLAFGTYNSSAILDERMRIDSSGKVGIGTTSPRQLLTLGATTVTSTATPDCIDLGGTYSNSAGANMKILTFNDGSGGRHGIGVSTGASDYLTVTGGAHVFYRGTSEAMRIDSSSRLLVGTSSVSHTTTVVVQGNTSSSTDAGYLSLRRGETATSITTGEALGVIDFRDSDGNRYAEIYAQADAAAGSNDYPGRLVFSTTADGESSPTERMRITSEGNIGFGSYSITRKLWVAGGTNTVVTHLDSANAQGTTWYHLYCTSSTDTVLQSWIRGDGTYGSRPNVYGGTSDIKLKENITPAQSQWNDVKNIEVVNFNFIGDDQKLVGVVAQQVETVSPGLVDESVDRDKNDNDLGTTTKSVKYSVLYMKAVKALQEAMERIETLEASNADLLARVSALESRP